MMIFRRKASRVSILPLLLSLTSFSALGMLASPLAHSSPQEGQEGPVANSTKAPLQNQQERYEDIDLFQKVLHFIEQNYVDEDKVKHRELIYGAIKGMMETLDPHSNFLTPEIFKDMKVDTSGKFGGLGIEIGQKENVLTVISPIEETPAWKAGIKSGDRIVKISGETTKGMSLIEAVQKMRGKKGTEVILSVYREGWDKIREIKVMRDTIKVQSVKQEEVEPAYGYVRLSSFNENAASDVKKAIEKLETKGGKKLKGLVFDLRNNPGGLLDQAVEVSSLFIDEGVVVSTIPRNKDQKEVKYARKGNARKDLPIVVLVNSSSASAAEIVAGALQDHKRAIIMGQSTFGKGSVQTVMDLPTTSGKSPEVGLKLTIARYYTPSGKSIQEKGVVPDIILDDYDPKLLVEAKRKGEYFRERDLKGHMVNTDQGEDAPGKDSSKEFKKEELDAMAKESSRDKEAKDSKDGKKKLAGPQDDDLTPTKLNPKDDYQVREAVSHLKSYELYRHMAIQPAEKPMDRAISQK